MNQQKFDANYWRNRFRQDVALWRDQRIGEVIAELHYCRQSRDEWRDRCKKEEWKRYELMQRVGSNRRKVEECLCWMFGLLFLSVAISIPRVRVLLLFAGGALGYYSNRFTTQLENIEKGR